MAEKLCMFCDHFGWNDISTYDYGGMTGGGIDGGGMRCAKGMIGPLTDRRQKKPDDQWTMDRMPGDEDEFRKLILLAERCPHYSPPKEKA